MPKQTITALYDQYDEAAAAVAKLESHGVPHGDISIVGNNEGERHSGHVGARSGEAADATEKASTGAGAGASLGTVLGGAAGLLTGLGLMAIPGVGPVVAAGWLVTTLAGAGIGALTGGLVGGLTGAGLSQTDAHTYSEGVRRGGTLVTVKADDAMAAQVMTVLEEHGSVDVDERAQSWRSEGWAPPEVVGEDAGRPGAVDGRARVRAYPGSSV